MIRTRFAAPAITRGQSVTVDMEVENTGGEDATGVYLHIAVLKPDGYIWHEASTEWPTIAPGDIMPYEITWPTNSNDQLGMYTYDAAVTADNADSVSETGDAFELFPAY